MKITASMVSTPAISTATELALHQPIHPEFGRLPNALARRIMDGQLLGDPAVLSGWRLGLRKSRMRDRHSLTADVGSTVAGDLDAFRRLLVQKHAVNRLDPNSVGSLVLGTAAVRRVLTAFAAEATAPSVVQEWASFVRRGFIAPAGTERIAPLQIDYELAFEDEIVEILHRLDEIGDSVDGEVSPDEISAMLQSLLPGETG
jgi:hypothetical protein